VSKDFQIKWYQIYFWHVLQVVVVMRCKSQVGEDIEGSFQGNKMSKVLMKLRLQKSINRKIQRENSKLIMQLQPIEEEKQRLQDQILCHENFHMSIFHELERKLHMAPSISKVGQAENEIDYLALSPSKNVVDKEDSSYSHQDGE
jgi:hypothetical protein